MRDVLDQIAASHPGLLRKFGGHAMAAGLSIKRVHYPRFEKIFDRAVREALPADALEAVLLTDGTLSEDELTLETARLLAAAGPWGQRFPEPLFHDEFELVTQRVVGEQHLKLVLKKGSRVLDAIAFRQQPVEAPQVRAAYRLSENAYRGAVTLQLVVEHIAPLT
jgi:single-stranded-DNA-specific exonuclease